jgi:phage regulator Rha-like protein
MAMAPSIESPVAADVVHQIRIIRGQRVLLDADLAALYGVATKVLNQAVRRNADRFPSDFLLSLGNQDVASLRSQFVTLKAGRGAHRKYPMLAFTEHCAIMAATILNSARAIEMSVYVVRAFVKTREQLASNTELARELAALKKSVATLDADTRRQFDLVYEAILGLTGPATKKQ